MSKFDSPTAIEIVLPTACDRSGDSRLDQPSPCESAFDVASYWVTAILGVSVAGAGYGLPIFLVGAVFGFAIAGFFSVALVVPFAMAVRAVCGTWRHPLAAPCFGGLVGFASFVACGRVTIVHPADWLGFVLGPLFASFVGQAGAYIATRGELIEMILDRRRRPAAPWRFSIRSALIGTASLAITLTLLQWRRPLDLRDLTFVAIWLPYQAGTLCLFARWGERAAERIAQIRAVSRETGGYAILAREARS
ncbi:hypothetical protein [Lacipirellula parvula]|uniref:Uncharacterized protein n=1 Tax=Lacipirellula parvula TaxID=2650471 RepID=A0A5K7XBQ1_9BACT|nr:hypothetical protein [Lacipirellula parvula]BBO31756.1 hypothetical protein PLANPX_1368 [Lacipirellula parvula]